MKVCRGVWRAGLVGLAVALCVSACSKRDAVDGRLVGSWQTSLGQWMAVFEVGADGAYRTSFSGPLAPAPETGQFEARDGKWRSRKDNGGTEEGTYSFFSDNMVVIVGRAGALSWWRAAGPDAPALGALPATAAGFFNTSGAQPSGSPPALKADWPIKGVPAMAGRALEQARSWQADAVLTTVAAQLLEGASSVLGNVETPQGRVSLDFVFCSPGTRKRLQVSPSASGATTRDDGEGADCRADQGIPTEFLDLADAVAQARERGMPEGDPARAELRFVDGVAGDDFRGWAWQIHSPRYSGGGIYQIPIAIPETAGVRVVDACALITAADAEAVLGRPVERAVTTWQGEGTWSCGYHIIGHRQALVTLTVDESPFRNKQGYMANQRRNGRTPVAGLGDEAYQFKGWLDVLVGDSLLQFGLSTDNEAAVRQLARQAVERLISGEAIRSQATADARLVGDWTAEAGAYRFLLSVKRDRALSLNVAGDIVGVLGAEDGRWSLVDRARKQIAAGSYSWPGEGQLVMQGDIAAQWRRVPDDAKPERIRPELLSADLSRPDVDAASGPWPKAPLDGRLAGLWEGAGAVSGEQALRLVWRMRAAAPSTLTWTFSGKGYVTYRARDDQAQVHISEALQKLGLLQGMHDFTVAGDAAGRGPAFIDDGRIGQPTAAGLGWWQPSQGLEALQWHRLGASPTGAKQPGGGQSRP